MQKRLIPLLSLLALALASAGCAISASQANDAVEAAKIAAEAAPHVLTGIAPTRTPVFPVLTDVTINNYTTSEICSVVFYSDIGDIPLARHDWQSGEFSQMGEETITISIVEGQHDVSAYGCDGSLLDSKEDHMISSGASIIFGP